MSGAGGNVGGWTVTFAVALSVTFKLATAVLYASTVAVFSVVVFRTFEHSNSQVSLGSRMPLVKLVPPLT